LAAKTKPGKYDAILPSLRPAPPQDLSRQEKIEKIKEEELLAIKEEDGVYGITNPTSLADRYIVLRDLEEKLKEELSAVTLQLDAYEQMLADSQETNVGGWGEYGVNEKALRLPDGTTIRVDREPYGQVKDKEAFRVWCIANGYERQLQLWPSTMNAIVKERLLVGQPEPDGCESFSKFKIVLTRAK
jgi:hypothetical protein